MRDVIRKVIATEAEARAIVAAARSEADRLLSHAQKQGQDLIARARAQARVESERLVEAAVNEAGREKEERLARAAFEIAAQVRLEETVRHRAVAGAVRCVCVPLQN